MFDRPKTIIALILLWALLGSIFVIWGAFSLYILIDMILNWEYGEIIATVMPMINFGYTMSAIVWFVFSVVFIICAYGTVKKYNWIWNASMIFSTVFLAIFSFMLASFILNALFYLSWFSVVGLISTILAFIIDLGIIFFLTRPKTKLYFHIKKY